MEQKLIFRTDDIGIDIEAFDIMDSWDKKWWLNFIQEYKKYNFKKDYDKEELVCKLKQMYIDYSEDVLENKKRFQDLWGKYEERFLMFMENLFECKFLDEEKFYVQLGFAQVYPRYIE